MLNKYSYRDPIMHDVLILALFILSTNIKEYVIRCKLNIFKDVKVTFVTLQYKDVCKA